MKVRELKQLLAGIPDEEYNYLLGEWDNILKKNNL
jgi:hypothetical protein